MDSDFTWGGVALFVLGFWWIGQDFFASLVVRCDCTDDDDEDDADDDDRPRCYGLHDWEMIDTAFITDAQEVRIGACYTLQCEECGDIAARRVMYAAADEAPEVTTSP